MKKTKTECIADIEKVIQSAISNGYKVVVSTDEEGNGWNTLNPKLMTYSDSKSDCIALGVFAFIDENEVFDEQ